MQNQQLNDGDLYLLGRGLIGEIAPQGDDERRRLDRSVDLGYVERVHHPLTGGPGIPPGCNYRLTPRGREIVIESNLRGRS